MFYLLVIISNLLTETLLVILQSAAQSKLTILHEQVFFILYKATSSTRWILLNFIISCTEIALILRRQRVIQQLQYQLGLYIIFCISKAEAEFPEKSDIFGTDKSTVQSVCYYLKKKKKSYQTEERARNSTEYVYNNFDTCNSCSQLKTATSLFH